MLATVQGHEVHGIHTADVWSSSSSLSTSDYHRRDPVLTPQEHLENSRAGPHHGQQLHHRGPRSGPDDFLAPRWSFHAAEFESQALEVGWLQTDPWSQFEKGAGCRDVWR